MVRSIGVRDRSPYRREWALSLSDTQLRADIAHCRKLRDSFWLTQQMYGAYYASLIGTYRAELARRAA